MTIRIAVFACCLAVGGTAIAWSSPQDPPPSPPSAPASAPATVPGTPEPHPFEGFYELKKRLINGVDELKPSRGYLAVTRRHMMLCVAGAGPDPDLPLLRAGVRTWRPEQDLLRTEIRLGWFTDEKGTIHVETPGTAEKRRFLIGRGFVRIYQDDRSYLEFERIE
ncbi:MAG TPA: hypothetical protein VFZ65_02160 [Planctomycetota bacterium]|nr:hypothetical protein [Planctomycetota bacterium]